MNAKNTTQTFVIALAMIFASAIGTTMVYGQDKSDNQSTDLPTAVSCCQEVEGNESVVNNGDGTTSGTITQGGKLNGRTRTVFTSVFTPTPDPNTFSFTDDLTLTTRRGVLRTHNVTIFDTVKGVFTAIARIDPNAGTGIFAGATGVLYINGKTTDGGATFQAEITGEICYAR